jgi:hypothetical protein
LNFSKIHKQRLRRLRKRGEGRRERERGGGRLLVTPINSSAIYETGYFCILQ